MGAETELDAVAATIATVIDVPVVFITILDGDNQAFVGIRGIARASAVLSPLCLEVAVLGRPLLLQDARRRVSAAAYDDWGFPFTSYIGVPIRSSDGRSVGAVSGFGTHKRTWQNRDVIVLNAFAGLIARALDAQRSYEERYLRLEQELQASRHQLGTVSAEYVAFASRTRDVEVEVAERAVHERHRTAELEDNAHHDELTGLLNRRGFFARGEMELERARAHCLAASIVFADIDNLKQTNDDLGHAVGDELLRVAASVLRRSLRDTDTVARLGGDEFAAIVVADPAASTIAKRLSFELESVNSARASGNQLAWSVGLVALDLDAATSLSALLVEADQRMYVTKHGRTRARGR
jgi:diguanylate cyclase (GGDEF)-like protein